MNELIHRLPNNFLQKLRKLYPDRFEEIVQTFLYKKNTSFRINYLKTDLVSLRENLVKSRVRFQELDFPKGAFLSQTSLRDLQETSLCAEGHIYVQNVSSMIPAILLSPQKEETVLDLCAAPGAKTTQLVSLAPGADIHAVEKSRVRYYKLLNSIKIQGAGNLVKVYLMDGLWVRKKFPEKFDKILVDTPCTTEGRFYVHNPRTYKYWKDRKVKEMVRTQKKLMHAAFFALKENGIMLYSTCTFSPEENEGIIDWFISKFKGKAEVLPVDIPIENVHEGFRRWQDQKFDPAVMLTKRILPNNYMEAFFIAKIKKLSA